MSDTNGIAPSAGKPPRRWLGPAFLASLAVNIFLIGLISVPLFFRPPHDGEFGLPPRGVGPGMFHRSFKDLPEADRKAIRAAMLGHFPEIRPHLLAMREAKSELADAVAADPYDEAAVRAAFDKMDRAMKQMGEVGRDAMMAGFEKLSPEQRKRVAEAMRKEERVRFRRSEHAGEGRDVDGMSPPPPLE
ncbi:MAG: periplasmic heavy metal sensor [Parvibaculum sp.]|nr:periplasmic heavy metal sensor [Parvibaculum sp.]